MSSSEVSPIGGVELERAAFVISIDTEMAWGLNHRRELTYDYPNERADLDRLLALFDRYDVPATWAIVGHLMLDGCDAVDGVKHPEIVRPDYDWFDGDWFDDDPCGTVESDPTWYAPRLVEQIRDARAGHEIGTHGFSHIIAGDEGCSRETFDSEMAAATKAAGLRGVELTSIVHPRNRIGHLDVCEEHGLTAFRGRRPATATKGSVMTKLVDRTIGSERTAIRPIRSGEMWNLPATILFDVDARPRSWRLWIRQVERRLDQAVARRSLFHLWFHPHNLRDNTDAAFTCLERLLRAAEAHRRDERLDTATMGQLAKALDSAAPE